MGCYETTECCVGVGNKRSHLSQDLAPAPTIATGESRKAAKKPALRNLEYFHPSLLRRCRSPHYSRPRRYRRVARAVFP
ncbi:hypothetical protein AVEN_57969-1 [Araneus ventricosus]|uniref:Uncharacterized protein n=1 Tax=Araneus ventricosus TaxID=182803 RepID=A0A4Y2M7E1_ARAVE|nr:hypothetical protein AVEN_57969-1 [Araneus ventricosus]